MKQYLYETHLHTNEGSACAHNTGREMAYAYKEAGYTGIIVTNHNWGGNTCVDRSLPWQDWVQEFSKGYEQAYEAGKEIDLDVFFGWEAGYQGTEFLIYGLDKEWMLAHEELHDVTIEEQYALVKASGGIVVHAHPFRKEPYIPKIRLYPEYVDGVEAINATHSNSKSRSHNDPAFNEQAIAYAKKYNLPMTAGSDMHISNLFGGGMLFDHRLHSIKDFIDAVLSKSYIGLTDGETVMNFR
ncbi:PHP domain-containing protein [Anaerosporobacter faecicola]|uniref:PHP domain-containing protein n=1 Tax=Anaerosporobacter faecicola TaxID=2718714 RepID=UPI00143B7A5C|nr:PHP domain-containing protein [Anaerosporobacter faecicola]